MEFIRKHYGLILFSIPIISLALHFHVLNTDLLGHHVWRQTETQTVINNFYREDLNILNPRINEHPETDRLHRMEFPVMQWIFALFYKLFGPHIIISRILSFIIGLASVFGMFYLCNNIFRNKTVATICAWCFNFSPVFYYYTINPMPDNMALCCGIWSLGLFYRYINTRELKYVVGSAVFLNFAIMAKLPFILYGVFIFAFMLVALKRKDPSFKQLLLVALIYAVGIIPACSWYAWVMPHWVIGAVRGVFDQKLNHPDLGFVLYYTIIAILPELLINYASLLFFFGGFYFMFRNKLYRKPYFLLFLLLGAALILYFLFEMNIIDVVHDYYLFPFLPPIFLIVAYGAFHAMSGKVRLLRVLSVCCLVVLPLTAFLRADERWDKNLPGFNPVYIKYEQELRNITPPGSLCIVGNDDSHFILLYYIDRKGWAFDKTWWDEQLLLHYMALGAQYIFIDQDVDTTGMNRHLDEKIFDKENLRVYKLK